MSSSRIIKFPHVFNSQFHYLHLVFHLHSIDSDIPGNVLTDKVAKEHHRHCYQHNPSCLFFQLYPGYNWNDSRWSTYTRRRCTNLPTPKGFSRLERNQESKRWRTACSSTFQSPSFCPSVSSSTQLISRSDLPQMPPWWTRSPSLALRMSSRWLHKTKSVWEPQRVLRVACHSTWGCGGVHKEDLGQPWRLTK